MAKNWTIISTFVAVVSTVFAGYIGFLSKVASADAVHAVSEKVQYVENRLDSKILGDKIYHYQQRIWELEDRLEANPSNERDREDLRQLQLQKKKLEEEQRILLQKIVGS